ncbi:MAG TPA: hypothetical protein VI365_14130, partial [Trebonia sp.]
EGTRPGRGNRASGGSLPAGPGFAVTVSDWWGMSPPVAMVFSDRELRTWRANALFRQLTGIPEEALIGRRPSETEGPTAWSTRTWSSAPSPSR